MQYVYGTHYDRAYWERQKQYRDPSGDTRVYTGPSLSWDGFDLIAQALHRVLPPGPILDVGCGAGDLGARLMQRDPTRQVWGLDISEYAIENTVPGMAGRTLLADVTKQPELPGTWPEKFDTVMATDFMEHIYEADLPRTLEWLKSKCSDTLFLLVACTDGEEFCHTPGQDIPLRWEGTAVAGHVNVRNPAYWYKTFQEAGLEIDWRRMFFFAALRDKSEAWRNTGGWGLMNLYVLRKP